jgi:hypothetical protein
LNCLRGAVAVHFDDVVGIHPPTIPLTSSTWTATAPLKQFHHHHQNEQLPLPSNNSTNFIKMNSYLSPQTIPPTSSKWTATSPLKQLHQHHQNEQLPLPSNNSTNIIKMNSYLSPQTIPPTSSTWTATILMMMVELFEGRGSCSFWWCWWNCLRGEVAVHFDDVGGIVWGEW